MICKKPYMLGVLPCGCGQCLPCRIARRRLWTHRMLLESVMHAGSSFVTLTYQDGNRPSELNVRTAQLFLKRLRRLSNEKIRYFIVGEYGEKSFHPHYHAAIFGLDPITGGGSTGHSGLVHSAWCGPACEGKGGNQCLGFTYTGDLSPQSASYIAGYVTKKLTVSDNEINKSWREKNGLLLNGRTPEFARMSLKPGIGAQFMDIVAAQFDSLSADYMESFADVPNVLRHAQKKMPIGRYLKSVLRQKLGYGRKLISNEALQAYEKKMRELFEDERILASSEKRPVKNIVDMMAPSVLSLEKKFKIMESGRTI